MVFKILICVFFCCKVEVRFIVVVDFFILFLFDVMSIICFICLKLCMFGNLIWVVIDIGIDSLLLINFLILLILL